MFATRRARYFEEDPKILVAQTTNHVLLLRTAFMKQMGRTNSCGPGTGARHDVTDEKYSHN